MSEDLQPGGTDAGRGGGSEVDHLIGALSSPAEAFSSIARRPTWLLALLVLVALSAAAVWSLYSKVDASEFLAYLEAQGRPLPPSVSGEQILGWTRVSSVVGAAVVVPLLYLAVAGIFLMLFRMSGSALDFKRSLSVTVHGLLPFGIAAVIGIGLATFREQVAMREVESGGLVPSSLAVLLGDEAGSVIRALASSVDLFSIWCIMLLALGFSTVAKVSRGKSYLMVGLVWGLGVLIKVGLASLR